MPRQIRVYAENHLYSFIIAQGQTIAFDLIKQGKKPEHIAEAVIENEQGTIIRCKYHALGGLFGRKLVERHVVILRQLRGKEKDVYQIPDWVGQLDLGVQVMDDGGRF